MVDEKLVVLFVSLVVDLAVIEDERYFFLAISVLVRLPMTVWSTAAFTTDLHEFISRALFGYRHVDWAVRPQQIGVAHVLSRACGFHFRLAELRSTGQNSCALASKTCARATDDGKEKAL